ncbi:type VI secretion system baseplate subunit TssK [Marinobacteraceae bacterium S3BR75-40.1]
MKEHLAKVAWSEGMLLRPQHFQQQDRFLSQLTRQQHAQTMAHGYGFSRLELDEQALALGQIAVVRAAGILPDGMPFEFDQGDGLVLEMPSDARDELVYLALPMEKLAGINIAADASNRNARYRFEERRLLDDSSEHGEEEVVGVARLNPRLKPGRDDLAGFAYLAVARVAEVVSEKEVKLDRSFIPPCLDVASVPPLASFLHEILGMVKQRAKALAVRMQKGAEQSSTLFDVLMLQTLNRWQPMLEHLKHTSPVHPERFYEVAISLTGELALFTRTEKMVPTLPPYRHEHLTETFGDLAALLSQSLSTVLEQTAIALRLKEAQYGIRVAPLPDGSLLDSAQLVLAVKADLTTEDIRRRLPAQIKLGAVEHIRDLVNNHLPGIPVSALPVAPRQIPYHAGYHYFLLDGKSDRWQQLRQSGGLAIHVSGNYPGLELELWAIRQ